MMVADCGPQIHLAAYHAKAEMETGVKYNNDTPGIGILCDLSEKTRIAAGVFHNSYHRQSVYASVVWQPVQYGNVKVGATAGFATGYKFNERVALPIAAFVMSVPVEKVELHLMLIPETSNTSPMTAEFSFSFKFK